MFVKRSCLFGLSVTLVCLLFNGYFWVVSDYPQDYLHWIADNLASALDNIPPTISVAVQLNITGNADAAQGLDESLKDSCSEIMPTSDSQLCSAILQLPFVQVNKGRPNLKQLISNEIGEATGVCIPNLECLSATTHWFVFSIEHSTWYVLSNLIEPSNLKGNGKQNLDVQSQVETWAWSLKFEGLNIGADARALGSPSLSAGQWALVSYLLDIYRMPGRTLTLAIQPHSRPGFSSHSRMKRHHHQSQCTEIIYTGFGISAIFAFQTP